MRGWGAGDARPVRLCDFYGVKCYQCGEMGDAGSALYPIGQEVCRPVLPDGWHTFDGWPVCPKHRVSVEEMNAATVAGGS